MSIEDRLRNLRWTGSPADLATMLERINRRAKRARLQRAATSLSFVIILIAGVISLAVITRESTPASFVVPGGSDWTTYHDATRGWSMGYPAAWHLQPFDMRERVSVQGALVSNINHTFTHPKIPRGYTTAWDFRDLPSDVVVIQFQHFIGGVQAGGKGRIPDTKFPLSLTRAIKPSRPGIDEYGVPLAEFLPVTVKGDSGYEVMVWFGEAASQADKAIAERIVESITFQTSVN